MGRGGIQLPDYASLYINLDLLITNVSVQDALISLFRPEFTDVGCTAVIGCIKIGQFVLVDAADITHGVCQIRSHRIIPAQTGDDINAVE